MLRNEGGHRWPRIPEHIVTGSFGANHGARRLRIGQKLSHLARRHAAVERVGRRYRADQDQHDQTHAFLTVVGAMEEAHQGAGQNQDAADPPRRRLIALRLTEQFFVADDEFDGQQKDPSEHKTEDRREQKCLADRDRLVPIDARCAVASPQQGIGDADADHRSDQRMRTRGRKPE